jgi:hypothetical protein
MVGVNEHSEVDIFSSGRRCIGWDRFLNVAVECSLIALLECRHIHVGIAGIKHNPGILLLLKIVEYMKDCFQVSSSRHREKRGELRHFSIYILTPPQLNNPT